MCSGSISLKKRRALRNALLKRRQLPDTLQLALYCYIFTSLRESTVKRTQPCHAEYRA